jgi:hypothetical protein
MTQWRIWRCVGESGVRGTGYEVRLAGMEHGALGIDHGSPVFPWLPKACFTRRDGRTTLPASDVRGPASVAMSGNELRTVAVD